MVVLRSLPESSSRPGNPPGSSGHPGRLPRSSGHPGRRSAPPRMGLTINVYKRRDQSARMQKTA
jgi:hypothetical protein